MELNGEWWQMRTLEWRSKQNGSERETSVRCTWVRGIKIGGWEIWWEEAHEDQCNWEEREKRRAVNYLKLENLMIMLLLSSLAST